jgi:predicted ATPase
MHIERIRLKNFKSFKDVTIKNMPSFMVVVGANGTGKTTLFDVFGFLRDCLTYNVKKALQARGGFKELLSRDAREKQIDIEIKFRLKIAGVGRLVTYRLSITEEKGRPLVKREILRYKRGPYGSPYHFLDFAKGQGTAINNEEDFHLPDHKLKREPITLDAPDLLAIKGLGQFSRFKAASAFRQLIEHWQVSDFHIDVARGSKDSTGYDDHLSITGDNLQWVARNIKDNHPGIFKHIKQAMQRRVPGIADIQTLDTEDGRLLLSFQDGAFKDPFIDRYVSDGTIKMFAYLVLLYDPKPHPLLCVEEPENQLYPTLLWELAEEFRAYARRGGQVCVSTHSPDLLNAAQLEEVFWLTKKEGYTQVHRAKDNPQLAAYMAEGDQMGYLWKQGLFTGVDPQ